LSSSLLTLRAVSTYESVRRRTSRVDVQTLGVVAGAMAHTYSKRGASTSAVAGKTNGSAAEAATAKDDDYSPNHVVYKKVS